MYSKNKSMHSDSYRNLTPPPGYDGSRLFTRRERSDGRDESFVVHTRPIYRGRDRELEHEPCKADETSSRNDEAVYADAEMPTDPFPSFPGVEAFLDEPEEYWEGESPEIASSELAAVERSEDAACSSKGKTQRLALPDPLAGLLNGLEREDLLLIGLLILLSADKSISAGDILLLLALLLITK